MIPDSAPDFVASARSDFAAFTAPIQRPNLNLEVDHHEWLSEVADARARRLSEMADAYVRWQSEIAAERSLWLSEMADAYVRWQSEIVDAQAEMKAAAGCRLCEHLQLI